MLGEQLGRANIPDTNMSDGESSKESGRKMAHELTANLRDQLQKTNQQLSRWTEAKLRWLNTTKSNYLRQEEECLFTINAMSDNDRQLDEYKRVNDQIRQQQQQEIDRYVMQIDKLDSQKLHLETQLKKFIEEETLEMNKLKLLVHELNEIKERKPNSSKYDEISLSIKCFLKLGLEFQKAPNDCMKFIFTQIDIKNPSKEFFFSLLVDSNDKYQFVESSPLLPITNVKKLIEKLNTDNDISYFVVHIRKLFASLT